MLAKKCPHCKRVLPRDTEHWYVRPGTTVLKGWCKQCCIEATNEYHRRVAQRTLPARQAARQRAAQVVAEFRRELDAE